jgi:glycogen debranching enzyme
MTVPGADHESVLNSLSTLTTKAGTVFALCAPNGDIDTSANSAHGLYFHDMRYLDRATLRVNGDALSVLLASADRSDRSISVLTNPPLQLTSGALPEQRLGVRRERSLGEVVIEEVTVQNFALRALRVILTFEFASSFDDIFVVRGSPTGERGTLHEPRWEGSRLTFAYEGADGRLRRLRLEFDPPPTRTEASGATYELTLTAHATSTIRINGTLSDVGSGSLEASPTTPPTKYLDRVTIETDNQLFNRILKRCFDDLAMLLTRQRGDTFFAAGVPWFVALFGRDSLITALETLPYDPRIAANTLKRLAQRQGRRHDPRTLEEPGRIMHELRVGEMANLREVPYTPYYGTVDATPLFIVLLGEYMRWTADRGLWCRLRGNVIRALDWIDHCGEHGLGFTSYDTDTNLGWKDSGNSIVHPDGSRATPPIALVEVQAYVYWAKCLAAGLFELDGDLETSSRLTREAENLRRRFNRRFWLSSRRYLALAIDRGGSQVESVTSNPGQALLSGIVSPQHVAAVSRMLISGRLFSGWGVRTLADDEVAYNPIDYQVGSVWPHDNALIAAGLKRSGHAKEALRIFSAVFEAAALFPQNRLPEVFAGFGRSEYPLPVRYPVACSPQAWAAGALPYMLTAMLGLEPDAVQRVLKVTDPSLPDWLSVVRIHHLQVGEATIDLRCERSNGTTQVTVVNQCGELAVVVKPK